VAAQVWVIGEKRRRMVQYVKENVVGPAPAKAQTWQNTLAAVAMAVRARPPSPPLAMATPARRRAPSRPPRHATPRHALSQIEGAKFDPWYEVNKERLDSLFEPLATRSEHENRAAETELIWNEWKAKLHRFRPRSDMAKTLDTISKSIRRKFPTADMLAFASPFKRQRVAQEPLVGDGLVRVESAQEAGRRQRAEARPRARGAFAQRMGHAFGVAQA
jgi:hypothetical protein